MRACKTVIACAVLHNIATLDDFNADIVEQTERADEDEQIDEPNSEQVETAAADTFKRKIAIPKSFEWSKKKYV